MGRRQFGSSPPHILLYPYLARSQPTRWQARVLRNGPRKSPMNERETSILLIRTAEMAIHYVSGAFERRVGLTEAAVAALQKFHEP